MEGSREYHLWILAWIVMGAFYLSTLGLFIVGIWVDSRFAGTGGILVIPDILGSVAMGFWADSSPWKYRQSPVTKVSRKVRKELRKENERRLLAEARAETTRVLEIETGIERGDRYGHSA